MRSTPRHGYLSRRTFVTSALLCPLVATRSFSETVTELQWTDLLPEGQSPLPPALSGMVPHGAASLAELQPQSTGVRDDWNGQRIRMPGYIVPLDFDGTGVTAFILVPYVGACIHVPPPPANQLVLVTSETPYQSSGLFEAVYVTGTFGTLDMSTDLAEIGYKMSADTVEPYSG